MIEAMGWAGALMFALCGLPMLWKVWRTKSVDDISLGFLLLWLGGEVFSLVYVLAKAPRAPLIVNYAWCGAVTLAITALWCRYRS